jgi:2,3-bisphosphoglycerate-dependent phosphoglycerate mutase
MDLFFIRHGQSANNDLFTKTGGRIGRVADPELTELGKIQANLLAEFFRSQRDTFGITHLYSSLMTRAIQTSIPIAEGLGLPIQGQEDMHESGGIYLEDDIDGSLNGQPGKNRQELQNLYPNLILPERLNGSGWWDRPFEASEDRPARARRLAEWIRANHIDPKDRVAIVSHYGFFNHLVWALIGFERPQGSWFVLNNTSVSRFEFTDTTVNMVYINRVDHLQPELITE